jgi:hypothetical protein
MDGSGNGVKRAFRQDRKNNSLRRYSQARPRPVPSLLKDDLHGEISPRMPRTPNTSWKAFFGKTKKALGEKTVRIENPNRR